jgi:DNA-binding YbaB/EbfC family protein
MQEKLHDIKVTGESGAGMVKVTLNGVFECVHIEIDPEVLKDEATLRVLLKSAHHAAWEKIRAMLPSQNLDVNNMDTLFKK